MMWISRGGLSLLGLAAFFVGSNILLPRPRLSRNDLHLLWLVSGEEYFVERRPADRTIMQSHPELAIGLRNGISEFPKEKPPGVFRIFCVGGSTTRGWPFSHIAPYPKLLSLYLNDLLPGRKIEVINAGFVSSDSSSDVRLAREISGYSPDLLLVYEGRNEEWQIGLHRPPRSWLLCGHAWMLRHVNLYGLLRDALRPERRDVFDHAQKIRDWANSGSGGADGFLKQNLRRNLDAMLSFASPGPDRVVFLTQVVSPLERVGGGSILNVNSWLRDFAKERGVPLIDVDQVFSSAVGKEEALILPPPSVHPDLPGYFLMAKSIARGLAGLGLVEKSGHGWRWENLKTDEQYLRQIDIGPADAAGAYAYIGNFYKTAGYPLFSERYFARSLEYRRMKKLVLIDAPFRPR